MNVLIINGSPKGSYSITLHTCLYIQKLFPEHSYVQPQNFYSVGGMKIFRDLIYIMRGLMRADHKFYKQHGIYDFPQKKRGQMIMMIAVGALMNNPKLRAKAGKQINEGMIAPYRLLRQEFTLT